MTNMITEIVALIIVLAMMIKKLNRKFRMYLEARPVPNVPDALLLRSVDILIESKVDAVL